MLDFFGWLRRKAREAILGGCEDAMNDLASENSPADLERFRLKLAESVKSLPPASDETSEPAKPKKGPKS